MNQLVMKLPLEVSVEGVDALNAVASSLGRHTAWLEAVGAKMFRCRVRTRRCEENRADGFSVQIDVSRPGDQRVSVTEHGDTSAQAVNRAFDVLIRMFEADSRDRGGAPDDEYSSSGVVSSTTQRERSEQDMEPWE